MSFGATQGSVRYAILVDDKATVPIQNINRQFTAMGTQMNGLTQKMNSFNSAINTNSRNFTASVNSIKTQGSALANNTKQLAANTTQVTTLGTKIKDTASKFAGFATGLAVTSAGVLQLAAGFRDYNDAQIAVERVQRKLSLATEAQGKATDKLNALTSKGVRSGKAYEQAQLDVSQANAAVSIQTQLLGEAQERLFDSQTQFAASVIPTTLGALGALGSAFKDLGGEKGMGGLVSKFKGLGGIFTNAGGGLKGLGISAAGVIPSLTGIGTKSGDAIKGIAGVGTASTLASGGVGGLKAALSGLAFSLGTLVGIPLAGILSAGALQNIFPKELAPQIATTRMEYLKFAELLGASPEQIKKLNDWLNTLNKTLGLSTVDIGKSTKANNDWINAIKLVIPTLNEATKGGNAWVNFLLKNEQNLKSQKIGYEEYTRNLLKAKDALGTDGLQQALDEVNKRLGVNTTTLKTNTVTIQKTTQAVDDLWMTWEQRAGKMANITDSFGANLTTLKARFLALNAARDKLFKGDLNQSQFFQWLNNPNPTAITKTVKDFANLAKLADQTNTTAKDLNQTWEKDAGAIAAKHAAEEWTKLKGIMESSDKAFKARFKIDTNVDKIFKDLVKGLPNKLEKKLHLQLKFEQNVDDAKQAFQDFLGRAIKLDDKSADKMANEVISMIDDKFKGKKGAFAGLRQALVDAIKSGKTPEEIEKLLLNFKWDSVGNNIFSKISQGIKDAANKGAGLANLWENAKPVKVPAEFIPPPPPPAPKKEVQVPSVFKTPPPIPPPKTPVKVPAVLELITNKGAGLAGLWESMSGSNKPVKVPAVLGFGPPDPNNRKTKPGVNEFTQLKGGPGISLPENDFKNRLLHALQNPGNKKELDVNKSRFGAASELEGMGGSSSAMMKAIPITLNTVAANTALSKLILRIDSIAKAVPKITLNTVAAHTALSKLILRIDSIAKAVPKMTLNTVAANTTLSKLIVRIDSISNMKPAPTLNTKPANAALSALIKRIDSIDNMKPAPKINQKPAQSAISQIINRINSISNMKPSVTVKVNYDTSGKPAGIKAQHGFHGTLTQDTTILAHKGERVDIEHAGETRPKESSSGGGGGTGGDLIVNNIIDLGNDRIFRSFKRKLGQNVYSLGA